VFKKLFACYFIVFILFLSTTTFAVRKAWWGGEIHANQTFGYGKYEATLIPGAGAGSITGFFNLCYTNNTRTSCISYNPADQYHFETDVEFTPTGNISQQRRWITSPCLSSAKCAVTVPNTQYWPRDSRGLLEAVSFNTFPQDNQVYYRMQPYSNYHIYTFVNLPNEVYWEVDGEKILNRMPNGNPDIRNDPMYKDFKQVAESNQLTMILNIWDGTQGSAGGFGGSSTTKRTQGNVIVTKVAYYPASCNAQGNNCEISANPTFLTDLTQGKFIKNGVPITIKRGDSICSQDTKNESTFWIPIQRNSYPVYVSPSHVSCNYNADTKHGNILLSFSEN